MEPRLKVQSAVMHASQNVSDLRTDDAIVDKS